MPRAEIATDKENFLHVEFTSKIFRFVDDVEFYFNEPGVIHFRSASRIGHSDMGVNRHRIEEIRHLFTKGFLKINFIFILLNNSIYHSLIIYRTTI